ncbi:hypothetical protein ACTU9R_04430 [Burkholderia gladioli]|uniref:hypothetical protein n=1 Tax=Burkholderia gladioli TaxID=28095 RepID=UPI003FA5A8B2
MPSSNRIESAHHLNGHGSLASTAQSANATGQPTSVILGDYRPFPVKTTGDAAVVRAAQVIGEFRLEELFHDGDHTIAKKRHAFFCLHRFIKEQGTDRFIGLAPA